MPLHTLRADIDFGYGVAATAYGIIGIKVWIFKGEIMEHDPMASEKQHAEMQESGGAGVRAAMTAIAVIAATAAAIVADVAAAARGGGGGGAPAACRRRRSERRRRPEA